MILSRIAASLRRQDWTAVAVEFCLVIAGVVIGLQITAWYEDRQRAEQERVLLGALAEEVRSNIEEIDAMLAFADYKLSAIEELARRIDGEQTTDDTLVSLFADLTWSRRANFSDGALTGTIASGALALISDGDLRRTLAGLAGRMEDYEATTRGEDAAKIEYVVPFMIEQRANPQLYEALRSAPGEAVDATAHGRWRAPETGRIDFDVLVRHPQLASLLVVSHANIADAIAEGRTLREVLSAVGARLEAGVAER